jgi:25S rRNA (uracil2843-N3)-methyltransferase
MSAARKPAATKAKGKNQNQNEKAALAQKRRENDQISTSDHELPLELQQLVLNIFQNTFPSCFEEYLTSVLQEVKGHLFRRDFAAAFGRDDYLKAYAVRWSPGRALGYSRIFTDVITGHLEHREGLWNVGILGLKIACLGGGAGAEIAGLAGAVSVRMKGGTTVEELDRLDGDETKDQAGCIGGIVKVEATFVDIADWKSVIEELHHSITTPPPLSAYASAAAKAASRPLLQPGSFEVSFRQADLLALGHEDLKSVVVGRDLITIFFTLNELYTTSLPKTQAFLLHLTQIVHTGTLFLVVDSAGSYSTISLNGKEKKYPMHWLLDHALLKPSNSDDEDRGERNKTADASTAGVKWEKLQERESEWFRVPQGLKYPLELENMRYQLHLYRRL